MRRTLEVDRHRDGEGGWPAGLRPRRQGAAVDLASPAPRADGVDGRCNNVDITYDLKVGSKTVDVAVVSDRYDDQLRFWAIDPAGADAATPLTEITAPELPFLFSPDRETVDEAHTAYGVAVWQPRDGPASVVTQEGATTLATVKLVTNAHTVGYTDIKHLDMPTRSPCATAAAGRRARSPASAHTSRAAPSTSAA
jgi:hypothetical protein